MEAKGFGFTRTIAETLVKVARERQAQPRVGLGVEKDLPVPIDNSSHIIVAKEPIYAATEAGGPSVAVNYGEAYIVTITNNGYLEIVTDGQGNKVYLEKVYNLCNVDLDPPDDPETIEHCTVALALQMNHGEYIAVKHCKIACQTSTCVDELDGVILGDLPVISAASATHVLGLDAGGCLSLIEVDECP